MIKCLLCSIANVYYAQANYREALNMHEDVLAVRVAQVGLEHPDVAGTLANIASVYRAQKLYDKALETYEKSLRIDIKVHGLGHLRVANTQKQCAAFHP